VITAVQGEYWPQQVVAPSVVGAHLRQQELVGHYARNWLRLLRASVEASSAVIGASSCVDTEGPVIAASFVSPTKVDVSGEAVSISVSVQLTDATGVSPGGGVRLVHTATEESIEGSLSRSTGSVLDGAWKTTLELPRGSASGSWDVEVFNLEDIAGNSTSGDSLTIRTIEVISADSD
jgi:hypothetical protein